MKPSPYQRIAGVETEFGCMVLDDEIGSPEVAVEVIKNHIFLSMKVGLLDLHARDEVFEPARSGGFLINGGRLYIDAVGSHLEYATAECIASKDLVAADRAGLRLITRAIRELGWTEKVKIFNNSVDHFGGHTFGCHENYLVQMDEDFFSQRISYLIPFLVTRQIYAGAGRVGGHRLTEFNKSISYDDVLSNPVDYIWVSQIYGVESDDSIEFQLSQRADHIVKTTASRVRFNRALINPKWEQFYSHDRMQRLHVLFGEANQMEFAYLLKLGTTRLVLRLIEDGFSSPDVLLARPLLALRDVSRDLTMKKLLSLTTGKELTAIELQRRYLEEAEIYRGSDDETDWTLDHWAETLNQLEQDPMLLADRLDWVAKYKLCRDMVEDGEAQWGDDLLHSIDLEYHNVDPTQSLYDALKDMGETLPCIDDLDIIEAMTEPPQNTRALPRSQLIKQILEGKGRGVYAVDWSGVAMSQADYRDLSDPFSTSIPERF